MLSVDLTTKRDDFMDMVFESAIGVDFVSPETVQLLRDYMRVFDDICKEKPALPSQAFLEGIKTIGGKNEQLAAKLAFCSQYAHI